MRFDSTQFPFRSLAAFVALLVGLGLGLSNLRAADEEKGPVQKELEERARLEKKGDKTKPPEPLPIADLKRSAPVDFEKELLPVLRKNCLACHNTKDKENDLVLESPQTILKGGADGPAVKPGNSGESLLLQLAAHQKQPVMPPAKNERKAANFTSEELGLLKLWIDQGAKGTVSTAAALKWQTIPNIVSPIYAVAISPDGQFAACGRANKIFVYHLPTGKLSAELIDPSLEKERAADLDLIQSLAFHPDGDVLASGAFRTAKIWRRPTNVKLADFATAEPITTAATSTDGKWAALGDKSGKIKIFDLAEKKELRQLDAHSSEVTGLRFTGDGSKLASASQDKSIRLWNVADGAKIGSIDAPSPIRAVVFLAGDSQLATGHEDGVVRLFPPPSKPEGEAAAPLKELKGHTGPVTAIDFSAGQLVSGSADGSVRFWNLENGQPGKTLSHGAAISAIAIRADGQRIISTGTNNTAKLWNAASSQIVAELKGDVRLHQQVAKLERTAVIFKAKIADQQKGVTEAQDRAKKETEAVAKAEQAKTTAEKALGEKTEAAKKTTEAKQAVEKEVAIAQAEADQAAKKVADSKGAADSDKNNADLAKAVEDAKKIATDTDAKLKAAQKKLQDAAKPDDTATQEQKSAEIALQSSIRGLEATRASAKSAEGAVEKAKADATSLDAASKQNDEALQAAKKNAAQSEKPFRAATFSADGTEFYLAGDDNLIHAYSSESGAAGAIVGGHADAMTALIGTKGGLLSASTDKHAVLWNASPAWTLERTIGGPDNPTQLIDRVLSLDFSPDGKLLATGGGEPSRSGELKLWNVADGSLQKEIKDPHSDTIFCVRFSPDGDLLATAGADRFMKIFRAADGQFVRSFEGHTHHVLSVAWRADGKWLATGGGDNVVKVWDSITGEQRKTIPGFSKEVTALTLIGTGVEAVIGCGDKSLKMMGLDSGNATRSYDSGGDFVFAVAASLDGKTIAAGGQDGVLRIYQADKVPPLHTFKASPK